MDLPPANGSSDAPERSVRGKQSGGADDASQIQEDTSDIQGATSGIVVIGEVLVDRFEDGSEIIGGAPMNVAWNLRGLGLDPLFVSAIGDDDTGQKISTAMRDWNLDLSGLQQSNRPTGFVDVKIVDNEPHYEIVENVAYDHVDPDDAVAAANAYLNDHAGRSILYHGSLCLRSNETRNSIMRLKAELDVDVFLDINVREGHFEKSWIDDLIEEVDFLKCNWDEIQMLTDRQGDPAESLVDGAKRLIERYQLKGCFLTAGEQGARYVDAAGKTYSAQNPPMNQLGIKNANFKDAVGAGDAFASAAIAGLIAGDEPETILQHAVAHAGRVCTLRGATTNDADFYRIGRS